MIKRFDETMTVDDTKTISMAALGTHWWIEIFNDVDTNSYHSITTACTDQLASIEKRFSRFLPDSLVSRLNRDGHVATTDTDFRYLIHCAQQWYQSTAGQFNILIGDALIARGYDAAYSFTNQERTISIGNPVTDIVISDTSISLKAGSMDLGGIGKGWAIDTLATTLRELGYDEFLINGGGDMYGTSDQGQPITIYLEHPTIPHTYLGTTNIFNQGFAASSPHKRRWKTTTGVATHIVSTHAIRDASFVIAPTAMTADILATCSLMLGDDVMDHLSRQYQAHTATYSIADAIFMKSPHFVHYNL